MAKGLAPTRPASRTVSQPVSSNRSAWPRHRATAHVSTGSDSPTNRPRQRHRKKVADPRDLSASVSKVYRRAPKKTLEKGQFEAKRTPLTVPISGLAFSRIRQRTNEHAPASCSPPSTSVIRHRSRRRTGVGHRSTALRHRTGRPLQLAILMDDSRNLLRQTPTDAVALTTRQQPPNTQPNDRISVLLLMLQQRRLDLQLLPQRGRKRTHQNLQMAKARPVCRTLSYSSHSSSG